MSESPPRTTPPPPPRPSAPTPPQQVIGDPTTMKHMGAKKGKMPDKGASKTIAKSYDVQSGFDDKGKMKMDEEGKALFKRLMDEQLANPNKKERLSEKQVKSMVKALQEGKPYLSDNPAAQKIMQREKGSVMSSKDMMEKAKVPEKEKNAMER